MDAARTVRLLTVRRSPGSRSPAPPARWRSRPTGAPDVVRLGTGVAFAGVLLAVALVAGRALAAAEVDDPDARAAARAIWDAFLGDLRTAAWILAGVRRGRGRRRGVADPARSRSTSAAARARARSRRRAGPARAARAARRSRSSLAGVACWSPATPSSRWCAGALGAYLIYAGASSVLRLIDAAPTPGRRRARRAAARRGGPAPWRRSPPR